MLRFPGIAVLLSLILAGCAISPPPHVAQAQFCNFHAYTIALPLTQAPAPGATLASEIQSALTARAASRPGQPFKLLALSGGSLHGAFGAGFLDGWRRSLPGERLPEFDVVTGISTGSILSTFAFLGDTERAVTRYAIGNESELLTPIGRNRRDGSMSPFELVRVVRQGAVADLSPLRGVLLHEITPEVMRAVAQANADHRKLYVGAVDMDSGQASAFDLTQMATDYVAAGPPGAAETPDQLRFRTCYVNAIVASSSAPLAAVPVFIDNGMYVDGGMRFGMFADDVIQGAARAEKANGLASEFYVIANGDLEAPPVCGRQEETMCEANPPTGLATDPRGSWSLLNLALRSEQVLVNQVYRFSADRIIVEQKMGNRVWFTRIDRPAVNAHLFRVERPDLATLPPDAAHPDGRHSCSEWKDEDERTMHPIQFFPRYMHCLIDYGRTRGRAPDGWDIQPLPEAPVAPAAPKP
jgi:predicted patatin/cPLA2 family phospholipase